MSECVGHSRLSGRGQRLIAENKNSYGTNLMQGGKVYSSSCVAGLEPLTTDVHIIDGISPGLQALTPYSIIKWSTQPERRQNLYNVVHAQISDKTASGFPFGSNSVGLIDFLGGGGLFAGAVHEQPNPLLPQDDPGTTEYECVDDGLFDDMATRMRTISPSFYRLPTDLVSTAEPLMTEGYFDMSATKAANYIQWSRGIGVHNKPEASAQKQNRSFLSSLATREPSYARIYPTYALQG